MTSKEHTRELQKATARALMTEVRAMRDRLTEMAAAVEAIPGRDAGEARRAINSARDNLFSVWSRLRVIRAHGGEERE